MNSIVIDYRFRLSDEKMVVFKVELDQKKLDLVHENIGAPPPWSKLDFHKCPNCTLDPEENSFCPLALSIAGIVERFDHVLSYDRIHLDVITEDRHISQETSAQMALSSLMGLLIATSGCPHTLYFKPMARYHLPLSGRDETVYRAVSTYLLAQYFIQRDGGEPDFGLSGLKIIYDNIQEVNRSIAERLRAVSEADSPVNALVILDTYAKAIPRVIEHSLESIRHLFDPYIID